MVDKDAYVEKLKAKIDEWNADLDKLIAKAKLNEVQKSSGGAWKELKVGIEQAGDSLKEAFKKAKTHFD